MSSLGPLLRRVGAESIVFWCPGCGTTHGINHGAGGWTWNGDTLRPTFSPSVLATGGEQRRCHSFVRNGRIEFLSDCTHELAGQTVDLPRFPYGEEADD